MDLVSDWSLTETPPCNGCRPTVQQLQQLFNEKVKCIRSEFNFKILELNNSLTKIQQQLDDVVTQLYAKNLAANIINSREKIKLEQTSEYVPDPNTISSGSHEFIGIKLESTYALDPEGNDNTDAICSSDNDDNPLGNIETDILTGNSSSKVTSKKVKLRYHDANYRKCKECNVQLATRRQLVNHMVTEHGKERPFKCERCPKEFSDRYAFRKHSETLHRDKSIKKRYYCDICGKILTTSHGLVIHKRVHTGEKPYECDICSKQYPQRNSLLHHMRTHTKERPYLCHECSKTFGQRNSFRLHLQSHQGIKPYKCEFDGCTWAFMQKSKLQIHIQSHTGERPVKCPICQKGYTKRYHVRKHIKNFHKISDVDGVLGPRRKPNQKICTVSNLKVSDEPNASAIPF